MAETKKCPYCGEEILAAAKKCKHCGEWLEETKPVVEESEKVPQPEREVHHQRRTPTVFDALAEVIGTVIGWGIVAMIIAAFTVPSEESHVKKIRKDVVECIEEKSNNVLDAFGLSSYKDLTSMFLDMSASQENGILEAFNNQNRIEVKKHWFWSSGKIYNRLHPDGTDVSFGIFGFVIPFVEWDDFVLLGDNSSMGDNTSSNSPQRQRKETRQPQQSAPSPPVEQSPSNVSNNTANPQQETVKSEDNKPAPSTTTVTEEAVVVDKSAIPATPPAPIVEEIEDDRILDAPEESAEFPGDIYAWLAKNIKYPSICEKQGVQGRVSVQFVINRDGSIVDVTVLRSPDDNLSKEAERVVKSMPKWKPARQGGRPVRMRYVLPVMFRLN